LRRNGKSARRRAAGGVWFFIEIEHIRLRSIDRVPPLAGEARDARRAFLLAAACAAAAASRLGVRPPGEWQRTRA
jgi:hypothetical protein